MHTVHLLDYQIVNETETQIALDIAEAIEQNQPGYLSCLNPHSYAIAKKDPMFKKALQGAKWLIPDGIGIVYASRILRMPLMKRVTGFDIFSTLSQILNQKKMRVFFLGADENCLERIQKRYAQDYPEIIISGVFSPPFKARFDKQDLENMLSRIEAVQPHVVWVGISSPKQDLLIAELSQRSSIPFWAAIGAVFDFYSGKVKRSHPVFQKMGLEWLPRLLRQPRRLWRRMLISAPIFVADVLKSIIKV